MKPQRIQLSRKRGWRMPPNTVKVDRTTKWGNPHVVGRHGSSIECVYLFAWLLSGNVCLTSGDVAAQMAFVKQLRGRAPFASLRGKNLGCWCPIGKPCHADVLLHIANQRGRPKLEIDSFLARYGWRMIDGKWQRVEAAA